MYRILTAFLALCWGVAMLFGLYGLVLLKCIYPLEYKEEIIFSADNYGLDRALIFAVVKTESSFDSSATSEKGAKGLMQITDNTGRYIAQLLNVKEYNLYDVKTNLNFGCYYMHRLIKRFKNLDTAIIAFNAGEGNVSTWLKNPEYSKDGLTLKKVPFNESKEYIKKIKENFSKYKKLYGNILDKR